MMNYIQLLILVLILNCNVVGQTNNDVDVISKQTRSAIEKIIQSEMVMDIAVGLAGTRPEQWDNFEELSKVSTTEELVILTNHEKGVVRCYAFWELSKRKEIDNFEILKNHLIDDEIIYYQTGCTIFDMMVGDFFIELMTERYVDNNVQKMTSDQKKELDSLLIYKTNNLSARNDAINNAGLTEALYPKIKELAIVENNQYALIVLAKYQKEEDIEIILNNRDERYEEENVFSSTFSAITNFPHPQFIPFLQTHLINALTRTEYNYSCNELYKAIASFKNEEALELLQMPFYELKDERLRRWHIEDIHTAVVVYDDTIYNNLYWKLWEEENMISIHSYERMFVLNPFRAYELTKKRLISGYSIKHIDFIPTIENIEIQEDLLETMLSVLISNEKELADELIIDKINNASIGILGCYTARVKDEVKFVSPLFKRLERDDNIYVSLDIIRTLIRYQNDNINEKIVEFRLHNKSLDEDWKRDMLDKLLKENNIF